MKEIKIGDWGWFWDDEPEKAIFGRLNTDDNTTELRYDCNGEAWFSSFSHEHPTGRFIVTENPNTVMNDPYAELKKACDEGKTIQINFGNGIWQNLPKEGLTFAHKPEVYRIKPEPHYRAYTFEDREEFRGRWIRAKGGEPSGEYLIVDIDAKNIFYGSDFKETYERSLD